MVKGHGFTLATAASITFMFSIGAVLSKPLIGLTVRSGLVGGSKVLVMVCFISFTAAAAGVWPASRTSRSSAWWRRYLVSRLSHTAHSRQRISHRDCRQDPGRARPPVRPTRSGSLAVSRYRWWWEQCFKSSHSFFRRVCDARRRSAAGSHRLELGARNQTVSERVIAAHQMTKRSRRQIAPTPLDVA